MNEIKGRRRDIPVKKATRIALVCVSAAVVVGVAVASWMVHAPTSSSPARSPATAARAADTGVTLTLHAAGGADTVTYTCVTGGEVDVCGPERVSEPATWSTRVTVPAGTTVRVQARGPVLPPWCSITDQSDRLVLNQDHETGECEAVADAAGR